MLFKISFEDEIHLFNSIHSITLLQLKGFIEQKFKKIPKQYTLTYHDADQDEISLVNQKDMEMIYYLNFNSIKIIIADANGMKSEVFQQIQMEISSEFSDSSQDDDVYENSKVLETNEENYKNIFLNHIESQISIKGTAVQEDEKVQQARENFSFTEKEQKFQFKEFKKVQADEIHIEYTCDNCSSSPIIGARFKCSICPDYDLCEQCEEISNHEHPFLKIKKVHQAPKEIKVTLNESLDEELDQFTFYKTKIQNFFKKLFNWDFEDQEVLEIPQLNKKTNSTPQQSTKEYSSEENARYLSKIIGKDFEVCLSFVKKYDNISREDLITQFFKNIKQFD